jgi:hypothetical protein
MRKKERKEGRKEWGGGEERDPNFNTVKRLFVHCGVVLLSNEKHGTTKERIFRSRRHNKA